MPGVPRFELRALFLGIIPVGFLFGFFVNNFSELAIDSISWNATEIGLLTAVVGVIDIIIQGALLGILLLRMGERGVSGIVGQSIGMLAGRGGAQAAMDGAVSYSVDEQGWIAGARQSIKCRHRGGRPADRRRTLRTREPLRALLTRPDPDQET